MWQLLLASENKVFAVALLLMALIAVLELVALFVGHSLADSLDSMLPEPHVEVGQPDNDAALSRLLSWLRVGQVPLLMLLVLFLCIFGLLGLLLQALSHASFGFYLPLLLSVPVTILLTLPLLRGSAGILQRIMPKDETTAVSADSLLGRIAVITLGEARVGYPAEARVKDQHGFTHYIQLEPEQAGEALRQGSEVLLLTRHSGVYQGILNTNPHLSERNDRDSATIE